MGILDLNKFGIRVSRLTNRIVIARFGKDPELALDQRDAANEFWQALCAYAFDHKMPEPGKGAAVCFGGGNEQFMAIIRRFESIEDAHKDKALREAAPATLEALKQCQSALAMMIAPEAIKQTTTLHAFEQATAAELAARKAIALVDEAQSKAAGK